MTRPLIRFGQPVEWRNELWRVGAEVCAPTRTVYVSRDGASGGVAIPPEEWAQAKWDGRAGRWTVPTLEAA